MDGMALNHGLTRRAFAMLGAGLAAMAFGGFAWAEDKAPTLDEAIKDAHANGEARELRILIQERTRVARQKQRLSCR